MPGAYADIYRRSLEDPERFWAEAAQAIDWIKPWDRVLDTSNPPHNRWFRGGQLNTCHNAVDRHVAAGRGSQTAIIYDSPVTDTQSRLTYAKLQDLAARCAGALAARGITKGDRVVIYMPMIPEALVAALACARLGAVHSIVFGGFAAPELAVRIDDSRAKLVITASCGIEPTRLVPYKPLLDQAIELAKHKPEHVIIVQRPQQPAELRPGRDADWADAMAAATPHACVPVDATDPLYILYTSGTTGQPKGIVRDNGGHAVALNWTMRHIYDMAPGEVYWAASDIGWVVGHSYTIYAPLLAGCTTVVYEGKPVGTPDPGAFWRVIAEHDVKVMFTAPTAIRAIRQQDPEGKHLASHDLANLRALFLAGERCDPDTLQWCERQLGRPVIDHWWQTETGWSIAANCLGIEQLPVKAGSPTRPCPGWDVQVLDHAGHPTPRGDIGAICVKLPLPPGTFPTLWNADQRYRETYFTEYPGYYKTGDAGLLDEDGYVHVMARTDDVINVAGHRLSTGAIEEVLATHPDVAECAVVGAADDLRGQLPVGLVVLNAGANTASADVSQQCVELVRDRIGAVAAFKTAVVVDRLPKTRSGKILRGTIKKIADGEPYKVTPTIEDEAVLPTIASALAGAGYAKP